MAAPLSIRAELATAIRRVNAEFARLPRAVQDSLDLSFNDLDAELDRALLSDDRRRALLAITSWRDHHLGQIRRAGR